MIEPCVVVSVYVFLGGHFGMVEMMTNLDERGLLATGEYLVIYTEFSTYSNEDPLKYFKGQYLNATLLDAM